MLFIDEQGRIHSKDTKMSEDYAVKDSSKVKWNRVGPPNQRKKEKGKAKQIRASKTAIYGALSRMFGEREFFYQTYADDPKSLPLRPEWKCVKVSNELVKELARLSDLGMNVGVVPNVMDGKGRSKENCVEVRWLFADFDKGSRTRESLMKLGVKPIFIVETSPGRFHVYWRIVGCTVEQFSAVQKALAASLGSDSAVSDPS